MVTRNLPFFVRSTLHSEHFAEPGWTAGFYGQQLDRLPIHTVCDDDDDDVDDNAPTTMMKGDRKCRPTMDIRMVRGMREHS